MSRASESAWSMDGEGDTELDFEANIVDGFGSNSPPSAWRLREADYMRRTRRMHPATPSGRRRDWATV